MVLNYPFCNREECNYDFLQDHKGSFYNIYKLQWSSPLLESLRFAYFSLLSLVFLTWIAIFTNQTDIKLYLDTLVPQFISSSLTVRYKTLELLFKPYIHLFIYYKMTCLLPASAALITKTILSKFFPWRNAILMASEFGPHPDDAINVSGFWNPFCNDVLEFLCWYRSPSCFLFLINSVQCLGFQNRHDRPSNSLQFRLFSMNLFIFEHNEKIHVFWQRLTSIFISSIIRWIHPSSSSIQWPHSQNLTRRDHSPLQRGSGCIYFCLWFYHLYLISFIIFKIIAITISTQFPQYVLPWFW